MIKKFDFNLPMIKQLFTLASKHKLLSGIIAIVVISYMSFKYAPVWLHTALSVVSVTSSNARSWTSVCAIVPSDVQSPLGIVEHELSVVDKENMVTAAVWLDCDGVILDERISADDIKKFGGEQLRIVKVKDDL